MLPFEEQQSFRDARRGFMEKLPNDGIVVDENNVPVWNLKEYSFIKEGERAPLTVNPSLWRQAQLLMIAGLFQVHDNIHQVRGADLANITFIEGPAGIVVVDPLTCKETAAYALQLYYDCVFQDRARKKVVAVIYTHCHIDHFGGVRGVVTDHDDADLQIIAPAGFLESGISENVYVGNAMARRSTYTYGNLLPARSDGRGQVGAGLGLTTPSGTVTLIRPTKEISQSISTHTLAGLEFRFLLTPDSEAPAELFFTFRNSKRSVQPKMPFTPCTTSMRCGEPKCGTHWHGPSISIKLSISGAAKRMFCLLHITGRFGARISRAMIRLVL